jgi:cytoskeleton protein RodZ
MHLPAKVIEAMENNDFGRFEPVYARGYLRNYARLLDLAAEPLIESYNQTLVPDSLPASPEDEAPPGDKSPWSLYLPLAAIVVPLLLWAAGKAFQTFEEAGAPAPDARVAMPAPSQEASLPPALPSQPANTAEAQAAAQAPDPGPADAKPGAPPAPAPVPPAPSPPAPAHPPAEAQAEPPPPAAPTPVSGQGPDSVAIRLSAGGWVSIRDQTGRRLAYENLPAGTERIYAGQAPFAVVLGNAPATRVEFNGQPFEPPKVKAGTVARFTLKK